MNINRTGPAALIMLAVFCFLVSVPNAAPARSSSPRVSAVVERLQKHYEDTATFSARFHEEIIPAGGMKRERDGVVYYRRPGRMRWEFATPEKELIVSDGEALYNYQPDLNQVIETPVKDALRSSAATAFLLGLGNLKRDFEASAPAKAPADGLLHVTLTPQGGGYGIELGLEPKTYDIAALRLTDQLGNVTTLKFNDIRTGVALDAGLFSFKAPAGADIVRPPSIP